jgi:hypothetical protein
MAYRAGDGAVFAVCATVTGSALVRFAGGAAETLLTEPECIATDVALRSSDGAVIVACGDSGGVLQMAGDSGVWLANSTQCPLAVAVAVRPGDGAVAAACRSGDVILVTMDGRVSTLISRQLCNVPSSLAFSTDGAVFVAGCGSGVVQLVNSNATPTVLSTSCRLVQSVAVRDSDGSIFAACTNHDGRILQILRGAQLNVTAPDQCAAPFGLSVRQTDGAVFAACGLGGSVFQLAPDGTMQVVTTAAQCAGHVRLVALANGTLVVACERSGILAVDTTCAGVAGYAVAFGRCAACGMGSARPGGNQGTWCAPCAPGYVNAVAQSAQCQPVGLGWYDPGLLPRLQPFPCPPGTISAAAAATVCTDCAAGTYRPAASALGAACINCSAGSYAASNASATCVLCTPVRRPASAVTAVVSASNAAVLRMACAQGLFANSTGQSACAPCEPGRYSAADGATACAACEAGRAAASNGSAYCLSCAPVCAPASPPHRAAPRARKTDPTPRCREQGLFGNSSGLASCPPCPAGRFAQSSGQSRCQRCQLPFFTESDAARQCSSCNAGLYAVFSDVTQAAFAACRFCPQGADCPAQSNMTVSDSFYAVRNATTMVVETFLCAGGRCAADGGCGENRLQTNNPLCGQCLPGYSEWNARCVACPGVNGALVFGLLLLAWLVVLVLHVFSQSTSGSSALRIAMFMWQTAFLIVGRAQWVTWAAFLDLNFLVASGSACPFPAAPGEMLALLLLGPLLTFALLGTTAALHALATRWQECRAPRERVRERLSSAGALDRASDADADRASSGSGSGWSGRHQLVSLREFDAAPYARTAIALYFFTFNQMTQQCLGFFSCAQLPGGRYMTALPAVQCGTGAHETLAPLAVLLLVAYAVVVPALILGNLWRLHRQGRLQEPDREVLRWWGVVYSAFRPGVFWWGLLQLLFRAAMVAATVFLRGDDTERLGVLSLTTVAILALQLLSRPNRSRADNAWETATLLTLVVLSIMLSMRAADALVAALTLGVGVAATLRTLSRNAVAAVARCKWWLGAGPIASGERAGSLDEGLLMGMRTARSGHGYVAMTDAAADAALAPHTGPASCGPLTLGGPAMD